MGWVEATELYLGGPRLYGLRPFDGFYFLGYFAVKQDRTESSLISRQ